MIQLPQCSKVVGYCQENRADLGHWKIVCVRTNKESGLAVQDRLSNYKQKGSVKVWEVTWKQGLTKAQIIGGNKFLEVC